MKGTALFLNYPIMKQRETLKEDSQGLSFMRANGITGKRKLYRYD